MFDQKFEENINAKLVEFCSRLSGSEQPNPEQQNELKRLFRCSEFCLSECLKKPPWVHYLLTSGEVNSEYETEFYLNTLRELGKSVAEFGGLLPVFRDFRNQYMLRIAWRDLLGYATVEQTLEDLSKLADACLLVALEKLTEWEVAIHGQPLDAEGKPMHMVVLAMGKLGAHELNFSSDIDLIFTFKEDGVIKSNQKERSHAEFFIRLSQNLIKLLSDATAQGFVFRVDARLRPFGNSGQLALSFDALETYYEQHGREWERYAMIKARPISMDEQAAAELMKRLYPFVYRRYLDFGAFASLREMKKLIDSEVTRKGAENNVKLGPGGIREVEFIGQAFQLIRGGRTRQLQARSILQILQALNDLQLLPPYVVKALKQAYLFLRKTENAIQAYADKQTHLLPKDELERLRLSLAMGFDNWQAFQHTLRKHMKTVHEHFEQIFSAPQLDALGQNEQASSDQYLNVWLQIGERESNCRFLEKSGYQDASAMLDLLARVKDGLVYRTMGPNGKQRLDKLMPMLIAAVSKTSAPDACLLRVIRLIEAIAKRTAYLALLTEHPLGLSQLVKLFDKSPWIADFLVSYPLLLDELLDPRRLYEPMSKQDLERELDYQFRVNDDDVENQMRQLSEFKNTNVLRVAASELTGAMPVEKVSDHLTYIAEIVVSNVSTLALNHMRSRHGNPEYVLEDGSRQEAGFCVIAYGKLGGLELGFGSDLDLVFLHDSSGSKQISTGEKALENPVYFARVGQRIIHFLNTITQGGKLYEVDMRLRPSGGSGLLVSSFTSFEDYQLNQAWTWEHQALIRARMIVGEEKLQTRFAIIRQKVLCQNRNAEKLRTEVREMRIKMRQNLVKSQSGEFDLKQDAGGITDIEFIIQYLILRWAHDYPSLIEYTDNLRLIEGLVNNSLLSKEDAKMLTQAYLTYRHAVHEYALQRKPTVVTSDSDFQLFREGVTLIWDIIMEQGEHD